MAIVELMVEFADVVTVAILNLHFIIIIILWSTRYNVHVGKDGELLMVYVGNYGVYVCN